jgi:hypothetical protein
LIDRQDNSPFIWRLLGGIAWAITRLKVGVGVTRTIIAARAGSFHPPQRGIQVRLYGATGTREGRLDSDSGHWQITLWKRLVSRFDERAGQRQGSKDTRLLAKLRRGDISFDVLAECRCGQVATQEPLEIPSDER